MHLVLTLLFAAAVVPQAQAGVSVATHARAPDAFATQPGGPGMELDLTPTVALALTGATQQLVLDYSIRAAWLSGALQPAPTLIQTGRLSYTGRLGPRLELLAAGWGRYGQETWLLALTPEGALPDLVPQVGRINVGAATVLGTLRYQPTPTQTWEASAGYDASGGMDTLARAVLPLGYGPRADLTVRQDVSGRDRVSGHLGWVHTEFSTGPAYDLAGVTLDWERRLASDTRLIPSAGVVVSRDARLPLNADAFLIHPALSLAASHRFLWAGSSLALEGRLWTGPALSRLDGSLESRAGIHAEAAWQVTRRATAGLAVDQVWVIARGLLIDGALQSLGARGSYTLTTGVQVETGLRFYYQQLPQRLQAPGLNGEGWDVYVGLRAFIGTTPTERSVDPRTGRQRRPHTTSPEDDPSHGGHGS